MVGSMASNSATERLLQGLTTALLAGILVVLSLLLVEIKRTTNSDYGIVIRGSDKSHLNVVLPPHENTLGSSPYPFYFRPVAA